MMLATGFKHVVIAFLYLPAVSPISSSSSSTAVLHWQVLCTLLSLERAAPDTKPYYSPHIIFLERESIINHPTVSPSVDSIS